MGQTGVRGAQETIARFTVVNGSYLIGRKCIKMKNPLTLSSGIVAVSAAAILWAGLMMNAAPTNALLTPWRSVGGCGTVIKDSLVGTWKWIRSCPDTSDFCTTQSNAGFDKSLRFTIDTIFSLKNGLMIAKAPFDTTQAQRRIGAIGINNSADFVSFFSPPRFDTLWLYDACYNQGIGCSFHIYAKTRNGVRRPPAVPALSTSPSPLPNATLYTLRGERIAKPFIHGASSQILFERDRLGEIRRVIVHSR
jgi:hypothetical protein